MEGEGRAPEAPENSLAKHLVVPAAAERADLAADTAVCSTNREKVVTSPSPRTPPRHGRVSEAYW